jgi:hypothetical protein
MHKRAILMGLAALGGVAALMIGTLAPASGDEGETVRFQVTSPVNGSNFGASFTTLGGTCGNPPITSPCISLGQGAEPSPGVFNDVISGDFNGTGVHATLGILSTTNLLTLSPFAFDIAFVNREVVSPLSVRGCGRGTLVVQDEGNLNSPTGTWSIVAGSGTGDLTGIRGGGTFTGPAQVALVGDTTVSWVGHISGCKATDR